MVTNVPVIREIELFTETLFLTHNQGHSLMDLKTNLLLTS